MDKIDAIFSSPAMSQKSLNNFYLYISTWLRSAVEILSSYEGY